MSRLIGIVAMTRQQRVIGLAGKMPWHLPDDLKFFRRQTLGHTVVMGRNTFDSIGRPLPQRRNVVLTHQREWQHAGVEVVHDVDAILCLAQENDRDTYIIGGAQVYGLLLSKLDALFVTHVAHDYPGDAFFPADPESIWGAGTVLQSGDGYEIALYGQLTPTADPARKPEP